MVSGKAEPFRTSGGGAAKRKIWLRRKEVSDLRRSAAKPQGVRSQEIGAGGEIRFASTVLDFVPDCNRRAKILLRKQQISDLHCSAAKPQGVGGQETGAGEENC